MNLKLTIFTPTYNRAHTIHRTYESILKQDSISLPLVEWLIIDDGSLDNTEEIVSNWKQEDLPFALRYIKQENGGKHVAFNRAIKEAKGEYFFTVDADDWLAENSIKNILSKIVYIADDKNVCGIIALKCLPDGSLIGCAYPDQVANHSAYELSLLGMGGERSFVFKTNVLKQYSFPEIFGERFCTECVLYDQIDAKYKYLVSNDILTICEYQEGGLTSNIVSLMLRNPIGYKVYYSQRIDMAVSCKERFGYAIRYWAFKMMKQDSLYNYKGKHKTFVLYSLPFGCVAYLYYKLKKV